MTAKPKERHLLYFTGKGSEIKIRYVPTNKVPPLSRRFMHVIETDNFHEDERTLLWLWRELRFNRRSRLRFELIEPVLNALPPRLVMRFSLDEAKRMYSLEYQRAGYPDLNSVFYRDFIVKLTYKLFTRTTVEPGDRERWKDVPPSFPSLYDKKAQVSSLGRIRWWVECDSEELRYDKPFKRKLLPVSGYHYAKLGLKDGNLAITSKENGRLLVKTIVAEVFLGEKPEGWAIIHLDENHLNCVAKNLAYSPVRKKARRKHLTEEEREAIRKHVDFSRRNNLPVSIEQIAQARGITAKTVYNIISPSKR